MRQKHIHGPAPEELEALDEMEELDEMDSSRDQPLEAILALGFPSNRLYLITATEHYYVMTYVGNELHMKEQLFPERRLRDADKAKAGKKDVWIAKDEIRDFRLRMKHCASTNIPNNASLKLKTEGGKRYSLILCMEEERSAYLDFFKDIAARRDSEYDDAEREAEARELEKEERRLAREKREEKQDRELEKKQTKTGNRWAFIAGMGIIVLEIALACCYRLLTRSARTLGILSCYGLLALSLFLVWRFPHYFSLRDSKTQHYESRVSLLGQVVIPLPILFLLSMDREHYDSILRLILISAAAGAVVSFLVWCLVRRQALSRGDLITILAVFFLAGGLSTALSANLLLSSKEPRETRSAEIVTMWEYKGKRDASWGLTLMLDGETCDYDVSKASYEAAKLGSTVYVGLWDGGIGIPYSLVLDPQETD